MAKNAGAPSKPQQGNFVSEWFGYRTYPTVAQDEKGNDIQQDRICPFLSRATGEPRKCIKSEASLGICSISSSSNGSRQDWLVCPYRALDDSLFEDVAHRLFHKVRRLSYFLRPRLLNLRSNNESQKRSALEALQLRTFRENWGAKFPSRQPTDLRSFPSIRRWSSFYVGPTNPGLWGGTVFWKLRRWISTDRTEPLPEILRAHFICTRTSSQRFCNRTYRGYPRKLKVPI